MMKVCCSAVLTLGLVATCAAGDLIRLRVTPDGTGAYTVEGAVDLLALSKKERTERQVRAAETAERRAGMNVLEVVVDHAKMNKLKYLIALSAVAIDRAAENNGWLYYKWLDDDKASASGAQAGGSTATTITTTANGDGNTVIIIQNPSAPGADIDANIGNTNGN